ncbi:hypothetical protein H483_0109510 [Dietzia sp. UCD-THP]|uniref:hypothetical protein n=1 Tax=Dietzia sp. UCD-THP TaxID=1292020 RepID=UPI00038096E7|nr:hypothetical protein [Dietzia sp. UCD-THP]EYT62672.1 hypothetical protein H483_0109510 [Dietzia sp. UCD-THP]
MSTPPLTIALGPPTHGVTRFAADCARAAGTPLLEVPDVARLTQELTAHPGGAVQLHFTETLFGATPDEAAEAVESLARDRPVAVTLHDVPQPAEGAERCRRRAAAYQRIAAAAGLVVVSSEHERRLCDEAGIVVDAVIPLPVPDLGVVGSPTQPGVGSHPEAARRDERSVGVFGFLHPGKAVDLVAQAVAELAAAGDHSVSLRLLGAPADGHEDYVRVAVETVRAAGGRAEVTGHIDDDDLARVLGEVTVPVALFRNVSASGSINTWAAAGRRPLVTTSDYTREMESRHPGSLLFTDGSDLPGDLRRLLDDPAPTRIDPPGPGLEELGRAYLHAWDGWGA